MRGNARSQISTEASNDPTAAVPPSPSSPTPSYRWGMGLEVFSAHISFRLINLESFLFLFCLWVSTSSLANRSPCYLHNSILKDGSSIWHAAHGGLESILYELVNRGKTQILSVISNFTQGFCGFVCLFVFTFLKLYLRVLGGLVGFELKCEDMRLDLQTPM